MIADNRNIEDLCSSNDLQDVTMATPDVTPQTKNTTNSVDDCKQRCCPKQYKQVARDLPDTQSIHEGPKMVNSCAHEVASSVDKLPDVQGHLSNAVISEELANGAQHGGLECCVISIESTTGESNEVLVIEDNSAGNSIIERIARFIINVYSRLCGRLAFREN